VPVILEHNGSIDKVKRKPHHYILVLVAVAVSFGLASLFMPFEGDNENMPKALGGETRPTLSPEYFFGKTARAYKAAREIPHVLDKIYCYCNCQKKAGHKSLLTCYVDRHGSKCDICMKEANMAYDLYKEGYKTDEIVRKVESAIASRVKN